MRVLTSCVQRDMSLLDAGVAPSTAKTKRKRDNENKNHSTKRHSPDSTDAGVAPVAVRVTPISAFGKHTFPRCDNDDLNSLCSEVPGVCDEEWSLEKLKNAPTDIARVQSLISHLMLAGISKTTDVSQDELNDDSGDELAHAEFTLDVLHDQCHALLQGLQRHLKLLFRHFKYR